MLNSNDDFLLVYEVTVNYVFAVKSVKSICPLVQLAFVLLAGQDFKFPFLLICRTQARVFV